MANKWVWLAILVAIGVLLVSRNRQFKPEQNTPSTIESEITVSPSAAPKALDQTPSPSATPALAVTSPEAKQLNILNEILESRNDNDMRMDRELRVLDAQAKVLFRERYKSLRSEKLNERGTIVFLLGRNIESREDAEFLCSVLREPLCQNLENCSGGAFSDGGHHESTIGVTLVYPQLQVLKAFQGVFENSKLADEIRVTARKCASEAASSASSRVSGLARKVLENTP